MRRRASLNEKEKGYFRSLVRKAGGASQAARVMECDPGTVSNHSRGKASLSVARVRQLERHLGVDTSPAAAGDQGRPAILTSDQLEEVVALKWEDDEDGYQRPLNAVRVAEIEIQLRKHNGKFMPLGLGELPDGTLLEIDGQHRRHGHIAAGLPCPVWIFQVESVEEARQLYLLWNGRQRATSFKDRYEASRNPLQKRMKGWERKYDATTQQVAAVARGLIGDKGLDFINPKQTVPGVMVKRAEKILRYWSSDTRWSGQKKKDSKKGKKKNGSVFAHPKILRALATVSKDFDVRSIEDVLEIIASYRQAFHAQGTWARAVRDKKHTDLIASMRAYIMPRLHGGIT
jgi:hypothetical protein